MITLTEVLRVSMKSLQPVVTTLLLLFVLLPGQAMGVVLCVRADGHMAVEATQHGRCGSLAASEARRAQTVTTSSDTDDCGPCIDVTLVTSNTDDRQLLTAPRLLPKLDAPALAAMPFFVPADADGLSPLFVLGPPIFASALLALARTLLALRTVVLLL
jgi:hypothetical protein